MPNRDPRAFMWSQAIDLIEQAERLQRQFFRVSPSAAQRPNWEPPVDVVETDDMLRIHAALPGVPREAVRVFADGTRLTLSGVRAMPAGEPGAVIHRLEIPYGRFERVIDLGYRRLELVRYEMADGCLIIELRKLP